MTDDIDRRVAEEVMGWTYVDPMQGVSLVVGERRPTAHRWVGDGVAVYADEWSPSTRWDHGGMVAGRMLELGLVVTLESPGHWQGDDEWRCSTGENGAFADADTAPLAICLAALAAVGGKT